MPIAPTYPGVYIEEIPSGVPTITGVATSITAFIGRAWRGPVNDPITINSYGDYERIFGGLWVESSMSYAVRDFYLNGGSQAIIVRLDLEATEAIITMSLPLVAANVGSWGNNLSVEVDYDTKEPTKDTLFNLTVSEAGGSTEKFLNVYTDSNNPRYIPRVLEQSSALVRVAKNNDGWIVPEKRPPEATTPATPNSGDDGQVLTIQQFVGSAKTGIYALEKADLFNLLCIPPHVLDGNIEPGLITAAATYCEERRAMLLIDPPSGWMNNTNFLKFCYR